MDNTKAQNTQYEQEYLEDPNKPTDRPDALMAGPGPGSIEQLRPFIVEYAWQSRRKNFNHFVRQIEVKSANPNLESVKVITACDHEIAQAARKMAASQETVYRYLSQLSKYQRRLDSKRIQLMLYEEVVKIASSEALEASFSPGLQISTQL